MADTRMKQLAGGIAHEVAKFMSPDEEETMPPQKTTVGPEHAQGLLNQYGDTGATMQPLGTAAEKNAHAWHNGGYDQYVQGDPSREQELPMGGIAPVRSAAMKPLPSYAVGTPYVPEDEVAQLHEGEAVVPAEDNPYAGGGAPAEFGGEVIPNPDGIKPRSSEEPSEPAKLSDGASMFPITQANTKPSPEHPAKMSESTSSAMKPLGGAEPPAAPAAPKPEPTKEELQAKQVQVNKDDALKEGGITGLTKLGMALVQEKELHRGAAVKQVMEAAANPALAVTPEKAGPVKADSGVAGAEPNMAAPAPKEEPVAPALAPPAESMPTTGLGMTAPMPKYTGMLAHGQQAPEFGNAINPGDVQKDQDLTNVPKTPEDLKARREELKAAVLNAKQQGDLVKAGSAELALAELDKQNPYGSATNHPGKLGKIEHVLAKVGNIAGGVVAPGIMEQIPGSDLNRAAEGEQGRADIAAGSKENLEGAQAEAQKTAAKAAATNSKLAGQLLLKGYVLSNNAAGEPVLTQVPGFRDAPKDVKEVYADKVASFLAKNPTGDASKDPEVQAALAALQASVKAGQPSAEANKEKAQEFASRIGQLGYPNDPTHLDASVAQALADGKITNKEASDYRGYQDVNPNPVTNLNIHEQEADKAVERRLEGKQVLVDNQQMSWDDAKKAGYTADQVESLPNALSAKNKTRLSSANSYSKVLTKYEDDFNAAKLNDTDRSALGVLTSHAMTTPKGFVGEIDSAATNLLTGNPLTDYAERLMNANVTKDQYDKLSKDGKQLVSDYFTTIISHFADMKNQLGSVPRNPIMLQAEMNTIPLPYIDHDAALDQFKNKRDDLKNRWADVPHIKGQPYPFEDREKKDSANAIDASQVRTLKSGEQVYPKDGKWFDLLTNQPLTPKTK